MNLVYKLLAEHITQMHALSLVSFLHSLPIKDLEILSRLDDLRAERI